MERIRGAVNSFWSWLSGEPDTTRPVSRAASRHLDTSSVSSIAGVVLDDDPPQQSANVAVVTEETTRCCKYRAIHPQRLRDTVFITHRRSVAKRGGCFQQRLFVCLSSPVYTIQPVVKPVVKPV